MCYGWLERLPSITEPEKDPTTGYSPKPSPADDVTMHQDHHPVAKSLDANCCSQHHDETQAATNHTSNPIQPQGTRHPCITGRRCCKDKTYKHQGQTMDMRSCHPTYYQMIIGLTNVAREHHPTKSSSLHLHLATTSFTTTTLIGLTTTKSGCVVNPVQRLGFPLWWWWHWRNE